MKHVPSNHICGHFCRSHVFSADVSGDTLAIRQEELRPSLAFGFIQPFVAEELAQPWMRERKPDLFAVSNYETAQMICCPNHFLGGLKSFRRQRSQVIAHQRAFGAGACRDESEDFPLRKAVSAPQCLLFL